MLTTVSCWYLYRCLKNRNVAPYPPGPKGHFLLGNLLEMPDQKKNEVMEIKLLEWAKEYGLCYTVSTPFMGKLIVISDPIMIWSILFNFHQYPKTEDYFFVAPIIGERSMVMAGREEWANMRKAFNPGFEPSFLKTMVTVIEDKLARFLDGIDEDIKADNPTNMLDRSQSFTSDVIVAIAFGEDWGDQNRTRRSDGYTS